MIFDCPWCSVRRMITDPARAAQHQAEIDAAEPVEITLPDGKRVTLPPAAVVHHREDIAAHLRGEGTWLQV